MADYIDARNAGMKASPPRELQEAWQSRQWGLPEAGGRLDQPAGLLQRMTVALNVYHALNGFYGSTNIAQWCDANPDLWSLVENVLEMRKQVNAHC